MSPRCRKSGSRRWDAWPRWRRISDFAKKTNALSSSWPRHARIPRLRRSRHPAIWSIRPSHRERTAKSAGGADSPGMSNTCGPLSTRGSQRDPSLHARFLPGLRRHAGSFATRTRSAPTGGDHRDAQRGDGASRLGLLVPALPQSPLHAVAGRGGEVGPAGFATNVWPRCPTARVAFPWPSGKAFATPR